MVTLSLGAEVVVVHVSQTETLVLFDTSSALPVSVGLADGGPPVLECPKEVLVVQGVY